MRTHSLAVMALLGYVSAADLKAMSMHEMANLLHSEAKGLFDPASDVVAGWDNGKKGQWDDDNSDEFMDESLKEAEAEVKNNNGDMQNLSQ